VRLVADVAVNGSQVFLGVGGALEYLLDGDPVVGNLVEEVVVAGGQMPRAASKVSIVLSFIACRGF